MRWKCNEDKWAATREGDSMWARNFISIKLNLVYFELTVILCKEMLQGLSVNVTLKTQSICIKAIKLINPVWRVFAPLPLDKQAFLCVARLSCLWRTNVALTNQMLKVQQANTNLI